MNESDHHPKLRVKLHLGAPVFVAGEDVFGKIEVESKTDNELGLRSIFIELTAVEKLTSKFHASKSQFIEIIRLFQGPGLPPSNAVRQYNPRKDTDIPPDYHPALKGKTSFFFKIALPQTSPSSIQFGGQLANITYRAKAAAEAFWRGDRRLVTDAQEISVVECLDDDIRVRREDLGVVAVGEAGKVWAHARAVDRLVIAGQSTTCRLHVKNNSLKKISGVTLRLVRKLGLEHRPEEAQKLELSDVLLTVPFKGPEYTIQSFSEGVAYLSLSIPRSAKGVRRGPREALNGLGEFFLQKSLFSLQCYLVVTLSLGFTTPDLELFLPIQVTHPSAISPELLAAIPPAMSGDPTQVPLAPDHTPYSQNLDYQSYGDVVYPEVTEPYNDASLEPSTSPMMWEVSAPPLHQQLSGYPSQPQWPQSPQHQFFFEDPVPQIEYQPYPSSYQATGLVSPPLPPPPRPLSADPYSIVNTSFPAITYPQEPSPQSVLVDRNNFAEMPAFENRAVPLDNPLAEDRASRISRHLRRTSRHRSLSPPHSRPSLLRLENIPPPIVEYSNIPPSHQEPPEVHKSPSLLSPRPIPSPRLSYFEGEQGDGTESQAGQSPRVLELERMVSSLELQAPEVMETSNANLQSSPSASASSARIDKTLPRVPLPTSLPTPPRSITPPQQQSSSASIIHTYRALPAAAIGDSSTIDTAAALSFAVSDVSEHALMLELESSASTLKLRPNPAAEAPSGLTLLERKLRLPAAYEIFDRVENASTKSKSDETLSSTLVESISATVAPAPALTMAASPPRASIKPSTNGSASSSTKPPPRRMRPSQGSGGRLPAVDEDERTARVSAWVQQEAHKPSEVPKPKALPPDQDVELLDQAPVALKAPASVAVSQGASKLDWTTLKRPELQNRAINLLKPDNNPTAKYDVRSARGGRGGVVTSAAAFWSNVTQTPDASSPSPRNPTSASPDVTKSRAAPRTSVGFTRNILPLDTIKANPKSPKSSPLRAPMTPQISGARAPVISLDYGINKTIARPVFSSSASLARDSNLNRAAVVLPVKSTAALPSERANTASGDDKFSAAAIKPAPRAIGPGRQRILELISKYQAT